MFHLVLLDLGIQVNDMECSEVWAEDLLRACNLGLSASNYLEVMDTLSYEGMILLSTEDDLLEYQMCIEVLEEAGFAEEDVGVTALNVSDGDHLVRVHGCQDLLGLKESTKMVIGITMVKAVPGQERSAYSAIKDKDEVRKVYHTFGECDFLAVIQAEDLPTIRDVLEEINVSLGVAGTRMIVVGEDFSEMPVGGAPCLADGPNLRAECAR